MHRIEIVRTNATQPWHARIIVNGKITWHTENYTRMVGAERAVLSLLRITVPAVRALRWNVEGREKVVTNASGRALYANALPTVLYVDERDA